MDTNKKDKWVDDVLNSMEGRYKAQPSGNLYGQIEKRIAVPLLKGRTIPLSAVSAAAACILILLTLNIYFATRHKSAAGAKDEVQELVQYYDITNDKNIPGL